MWMRDILDIAIASIITVQSMISANNYTYYDLRVVSVCSHITLSHYHNYADLLESIEYVKWQSGTVKPLI